MIKEQSMSREADDRRGDATVRARVRATGPVEAAVR